MTKHVDVVMGNGGVERQTVGPTATDETMSRCRGRARPIPLQNTRQFGWDAAYEPGAMFVPELVKAPPLQWRHCPRGGVCINPNCEWGCVEMSTNATTAIMELLEEMRARQEPLGREFEAAIFEDIEEIYER